MDEFRIARLQVPGMYCPKCEERIGIALGHLAGATLLRADHVRGEVEVRVAGGDPAATLAEVRRRVEAIGYAVVAER